MYVIRNQHIDLPHGFAPCVTDDIYSEIIRIRTTSQDTDIVAVVDDDDDSVVVDDMVANVADLRARHPGIGIIVVSDIIRPYMRFADDVVDDPDTLRHAVKSLRKAMTDSRPLARNGMQLTEFGDLTWCGETHRLTPGQHVFARAVMTSLESQIQFYSVQDRMRKLDVDSCPALNTIASHAKNIRALFATPCPFRVFGLDRVEAVAEETRSVKKVLEARNRKTAPKLRAIDATTKPKRKKTTIINGIFAFINANL